MRLLVFVDFPAYLRPPRPDQPVVLVAEDNVVAQNLVRVLLEKDGYFVLTAETGEDALLLSRKCHFDIHLLLSDVCMPKMSGIELSKILKKEHPQICVVLMSGYCEEHTNGFVFLNKPFDPKQLSETIKGLLPVCGKSPVTRS